MIQPGRNYSIANTNYRYGFNGQEKSTEINGSSYTAEFWQYDSRIGRRWNVDPKPSFGISKYVSFFDNPILYADLLGDSGKPKVKLVSPSEIVPRYKLNDPTYIKDINHSTAQNKNKKQLPLISATGAITLGTPGTFAFEGKLLGVKVGLSQSYDELDVLSLRDNIFYGAGKNLKTGEKERRSGFGIGVLAYGTEQYGEQTTNSDGKTTQTIKREYNVPLLTYTTETDEKGKVKSTFSTPIAHIKLGFIVGIELGVKVNYPEGVHVATPPRTNYEISESTSAGLPKILIYQFK